MVNRTVLYISCLLAGLLPACATAEAFGPAALTRERSAAALEVQLAALQAGPSDVGAYECSYPGGQIHYVGGTTLQLVNCLIEAPAGAQRLVISSTGGEVNQAIFAAYVLKSMALDVEVVGWCVSSCANYIAPAARRLYLDQHSIMYVHGAPQPPDRDRLIEALGRNGLTPDQPRFESVVSDNLMRSELTYRLHNNFRREFSVGEGYYDIADIWSARAVIDKGPGKDLIFVDPDWLKSCLGSIEVITEPTNREALETLLPQYNLVAFSDIRGPDANCGP
ncbi:MAG: hypothetical protein ACK46Q_11885 [Hyphomonas sp.]